MDQQGNLVSTGPPNITPFEDGVPRHHTRLYVDEVRSLAVVVGERLIPLQSTEPFADAIDGLYGQLEPSNLTVLTGIPVAHGPEDHVPFYIATEDYRNSFSPGLISGRWGPAS